MNHNLKPHKSQSQTLAGSHKNRKTGNQDPRKTGKPGPWWDSSGTLPQKPEIRYLDLRKTRKPGLHWNPQKT